MKENTTYRSMRFFNLLRVIFSLSFILFILAKPIANFVFHIADIEYELCEIFWEVDSEEKEDTSESEEDEKKPHVLRILNSKFHSNYKNSVFTFLNLLLISSTDTPLQPPEDC